MPINFCFHVYAQNFIGENGNEFFFDSLIIITLASDNTNSRAGSQLKIDLIRLSVIVKIFFRLQEPPG